MEVHTKIFIHSVLAYPHLVLLTFRRGRTGTTVPLIFLFAGGSVLNDIARNGPFTFDIGDVSVWHEWYLGSAKKNINPYIN